MKTKYFVNLLLVLLLAMTSCREITVSTIVHNDGSFTRIITVTGDSTDVFDKNLPYPVDDSWQAVSEKDTLEKGKYKLSYTKTFKDSRSLNKEIAADTTWRKQLDRYIEIKKSFGFFYSYPKYRETIKAANPFSEYDYSEYLNHEDILWLSGQRVPLNKEDSAKLESADERMKEYFEDILTKEIIEVLEQGIADLDNPVLVPQDVVLYKDSIKYKLDEYFQDLSVYIDFYSKWTANPEVKKLHDIDPPIFRQLNKKVKFLFEVMAMETYTVDVEMPGIIMQTNSTKLEGNKVEWTTDSMSFLLEDYEMYVKSRTVNKWAFWVAGGILLLLIALLIYRGRK